MTSSRKLVSRVIALQRRRAQERQNYHNHSTRGPSPTVSNVSSIAPSAYDYSVEQQAESSKFEDVSSIESRMTQSHGGRLLTSTPTSATFLGIPAPDSFRHSQVQKPTQPRLRQCSAGATSSARIVDWSRKAANGMTLTSTSRAASTSAIDAVSATSGGSVRATLPTISYLKLGEYKPIATSSRFHVPRSTSQTALSGLPVEQRVLSPPPSSALALSESWNRQPLQPRLKRVGSGGAVSTIVDQIEESESSREEELRRVRELFPGNPGRKRTASREFGTSILKRTSTG
jgi:hypothetical protein